jgi:hypothetical protein
MDVVGIRMVQVVDDQHDLAIWKKRSIRTLGGWVSKYQSTQLDVGGVSKRGLIREALC